MNTQLLPDWHFRWITDDNWYEDASLISNWKKVFYSNTQNHVFFHPSLATAWYRSYQVFARIKPLICIADNGSTEIILPLATIIRNYKNLYQRVIVPFGCAEFDYHDPISSRSLSSIEINSFWQKVYEVIKKEIPFDVLHIPGLKQNCTSDIFVKEADIAPFLDVSCFNDYDGFLRGLKSSLRGDILRQERRLSESGSISLKVYCKEELAEALNDLEIFIINHNRRWPKAFKPPDFHKNLLKYGLCEKLVHFSVIRVNDKPINWHLGFLHNDTMHYYMHTFDYEFQNYSPGKLHLVYLIKYCIENKLKMFDFMRGKESYKFDMTNNYQELWQIYFENNSILSILKNKSLSLVKSIF